MVLSLDVPDIFILVPTGTCWALTGVVILTPCVIEDDGSCDVNAFEVTFVLLLLLLLLDEFNELRLDESADADELDLTGSCDAFEVTFVLLLDTLAAGGIIGNCGNGDSTVWPYVLVIQAMLTKIFERVIPTTISKLIGQVELIIL